MIHIALKFLEFFLNTELKEHPGDPPVVTLSNIEKDTKPHNDDKIYLTLLNIEEERNLKNQNPYLKNDNGFDIINPEIKLNLYVMFSAHYRANNYFEALKQISRIIGNLQAKNVFEKEDFLSAASTGLDTSGLETLIADPYSLSLEQTTNLWQAFGGDLVPSVIYKLRLLIIQKEKSLRTVQEIKGVRFDLTR
jgi:hypothetical protein